MMLLALVLAAFQSEDPVRLAKKTLGTHLSIPESGIELVSAEPTEWRDASLGCPSPGNMYAQVLVPGYRVTLRAKDKTYPVHVGDGRAVVCEKAASPEAILAQKAREDLSRRLGLETARIETVSTTPHTWPDASLGCPDPDEMYAQMLTEGYVITLRANGKVFTYHTDRVRVVYCSKP